MSRFDAVTVVAWLGVLPLWLAVELTALWLRGKPIRPLPRTISMIARDRGWQLTSVVYFWSAMPVHWWAPIGWATVWGTAVFWSIDAALLAWNITALALGLTRQPDPKTWRPWLRWANLPLWYLIAGPIAAAFLFPQSGYVPW